MKKLFFQEGHGGLVWFLVSIIEKFSFFEKDKKINHNFVPQIKSNTMKRVIYLLGLFLLMAGAVKAQEVKNGAEIEFEKIIHDYGVVPYGGNGECEFRFTNTGTEPLIVQKPKSSCGCTVPTWPKEPILPGESDVIKVTYKTTRAGNINKTITVTSNAVQNTTVVLRIKGKVMDKPTEVMPEKDSSLGNGSPVNNN